MTDRASEPENSPGLTLDSETILVAPERPAAEVEGLKPDERRLVALADGTNSVAEILRRSGGSGTATMRTLRSLSDRGFLRALRPATIEAPESLTATLVDAQVPAPLAKTQTFVSQAARPRMTQDLTEFIGKRSRVERPAAGSGPPPGDADPWPESAPNGAPTVARAVTAEAQAVADAAESNTTAPPQAKAAHKATLVGLDPIVRPRRPDGAPAPTSLVGTISPVPVPAKAGMTTPIGSGGRRSPTIATAGVLETQGTVPNPTLDRPTRIGAYEVVARMAQGGVGSIYLCRRAGVRGFQRLYVLKVIRQHSREAEMAARSFLREARVGALLSHPNVLPVVDVGFYQDQPFLLLDYVEGTSLGHLLNEGTRCPPSLLVPIVVDVLRGLERAHDVVDEHGERLGLVHGDVSPSNIIVGTDGAARLTDFGSARFTGKTERGTELTPMVKPAFMAPEQLKGETIDSRTDLFSLGVVVWTALTGRKLFAGASYDETVVNVLSHPIVPPSTLGAPRFLDEICMKALARNPAQRYQNAEEMLAAVLRVATAQEISLGGRGVGPWVRRTVADVLAERQRRLNEIATGAAEPIIVSADGFDAEKEEAQAAADSAPVPRPGPRGTQVLVNPGAPAPRPRARGTAVLATPVARGARPRVDSDDPSDSDSMLDDVPRASRPRKVGFFDYIRFIFGGRPRSRRG